MLPYGTYLGAGAGAGLGAGAAYGAAAAAAAATAGSADAEKKVRLKEPSQYEVKYQEYPHPGYYLDARGRLANMLHLDPREAAAQVRRWPAWKNAFEPCRPSHPGAPTNPPPLHWPPPR